MKTIEQEIKSVKEWLILNSGATPYIVSVGMKQWTKRMYELYPDNFVITFCGMRFIKSGSEGQFIADKDEYFRSFDKIINDRKTLQKVYEDFLAYEERFKAFISTVHGSGEQYLHDHFDEFIRLYDDEYACAVVIDGVLVYGERLFSDMQKKYPKYEHELRVLVEQYGETFLNRFKQALLKLYIDNKDAGYETLEEIIEDKKISKQLDEIQRSFHWIKNNYKNVSALPVGFFAEQLLEIFQEAPNDPKKELDDLKTYSARHCKECDSIRLKGIIQNEDYDKLLWLGKIAWWVDRRKEYNLIANHYLGLHLSWLCKNNGLDYDKASFLLPQELDEVISGKKKIVDFPIGERQNGGIYFCDIYGQEAFFTGDHAQKIWKSISPEISKEGMREMRGMIANKGKVSGKVRVVMDAHNPGQFDNGDILVTGMTRPDFLSLMKKAAAFVTDEGGITCHAAIVARELNKPCIIGTKIATQVFKDGDMVEVDADNGIVRIIK